MALHPATQDWIRRVVTTAPIIGAPLAGGVTSQVYAVGENLVLKQVTNERWLSERPDVVAYEARVLSYLRNTAIPAPTVVAVDPDGTHAGHPTLLLEALAGGPAGDVAPPQDWLETLAEVSADISALEAPAWIRGFSRYQEAGEARPPSWASNPTIWDEVCAIVAAEPPKAPVGFIHRDFHPWNVLWDGRLTGVVDWSQTSVGPLPMDAAHCRANLAIRFDVATADRYTELWQRSTGLVHDAYWDLVTCVDFLPDWRPSARGNAALDDYVADLLGRIS